MLDRGWQLKLFEYREKHTLEGAIRRLRKDAATEGRSRSTCSTTPRTTCCGPPSAHRPGRPRGVRRRRRRGPPTPARGRCSTKVCDLYALSTIEEDKAWFLEHGQLTPTRAKALTGDGQPAAQGAAAAPAHAGRRLRHPGRVAGLHDPRGGARPAGGHGRPRRRGAAGRGGTQASKESATDLEVAPAPVSGVDHRRDGCPTASRAATPMITGVRPLILGMEADGEQRDVVLGVGQEQPRSTLSHSSSSGSVGAPPSTGTQLVGAGVEVAVAPLDQPVGVAAARCPRGEDDGAVGRAGCPGATPSSRSAGAPSSTRDLPVRRRAPPAAGARRWPSAAAPRRAQPGAASARAGVLGLQPGHQRRRHGVQREALRRRGRAR